MIRRWFLFAGSLGLLMQRQDIYGADILAFSPWPAFFVAILLTGIIAFLIGLPVIRLKGHYMAMATLGFGLIIYRIVLGGSYFRPGGRRFECAAF